jgi:hypothetical protein
LASHTLTFLIAALALWPDLPPEALPKSDGVREKMDTMRMSMKELHMVAEMMSRSLSIFNRRPGGKDKYEVLGRRILKCVNVAQVTRRKVDKFEAAFSAMEFVIETELGALQRPAPTERYGLWKSPLGEVHAVSYDTKGGILLKL